MPDAADRRAAVVFRPRRLRVVAWLITVALCGATAFGWFALPVHIRVLFTLSQRLTLLAVLGALVLVMLAVAASSVRADDEGVRVRNGLRVHRVPWSRVQQVMLRPGDAWAFLLLSPADGRTYTPDLDAEKRHLVGVQASDGAYAERAVAELRRRREDAVTRSRAT